MLDYCCLLIVTDSGVGATVDSPILYTVIGDCVCKSLMSELRVKRQHQKHLISVMKLYY